MRRALLLAAVFSMAAWADKKHPNPFLSQAKAFFTQGDGDKCLKRLLQAGEKWKHNDKHDLADIELYGGMCGYLTGEQQAAEVSFQRAFKLDPKIALPADAGAGIEGLWAKVTGKPVPIASGSPPPAQPDKPVKKDDSKAGKQETAQAAPPAPPPPYTDTSSKTGARTIERPEEEPVVVSTSPSKGRSFVLPVVLGVGAIGAGVAGLALGLTAKGLQNQYNSPDTFQSQAAMIKGPATTDALVANILFAAAGALLIGTLAILIFGG
jgi:hypothetical protein